MYGVKITKKQDMVDILGVNLTNVLLKHCKRDKHYRSKPMRISFTRTKPKFYLGDSETLFAILVDLGKEEIIAEEYCGSYDTILHHLPAQLGEGGDIPNGYAVVFQRNTYLGGKNFTGYSLTFVSPNITEQIKEN